MLDLERKFMVTMTHQIEIIKYKIKECISQKIMM